MHVRQQWVEPNAAAEGVVEQALEQPVLVISGAIGSGKTRLLQEVLDRLLEETPFSVPPAPMPPTTPVWRRLSTPLVDITHWASVWRVVLVTSIFTHLYEHRTELPPDYAARIEWGAARHLPKALFGLATTKHPNTVVTILADSPATQKPAARFNEARWTEIEEIVRACPAARFPPLLLEIDHLDEYFDNDPSIMAETQAGLALHLSQLARAPIAQPDRLRIHAAVRPSTNHYLWRMTGHNLTNDRCFIDLKWTKSAIRQLLEKEITRHGGCSLPELADNPTVHVAERGVDEDVAEYLLRHTTLTPRAIESIVRVVIARLTAAHRVPEDQLKAAVADYAERLADLTLQQLVSDMRALGARSLTGSRLSAGGEPSGISLKERLIIEFERISNERFDWTQLQALVTNWEEATAPHLTDCLWLHRILAQFDDHNSRFSVSRRVDSRLGTHVKDLMLHPILLDRCNLAPSPRGVTIEFSS